MFWRHFFALASAVLAANASAHAATVSIALKDAHGMPASDAVVTLSPITSNGSEALHAPDEALIDQRHQTFLPLVVLIRRGGHVVFTNNDNTMHQVYSFSSIKRFEYEIEKGHRSVPVVFDKAGIAAIGCNIHDNMIAYAFVSDAPFAVLTDAKGLASVTDIPPGSYRAEIWHPRLMPGPAPAMTVTVTDSGAAIVQTLSLTADKMSGMHKQHKQSY